ncbi:RING finger protein 112 isoform X1 [Alligator mississippiensis]|uniref:RING finger protein 112 n=1 Tax=Alligator mississippiensis TaxID=8496 RepID=A0A151MVZ5_ALLMI|nr:RING finger protein 112 isoform X1 [Alligator mississippiensis]KYO28665.1 RING finger protein 112 [Alligator mississippiensis]
MAPVPIVRVDEEGHLALDEGVLHHCLEQGGMGDAPVCLVSIIGEQRQGKSFLMNYLLRRLQNQEIQDASWMGQEDQSLEGFQWQGGDKTVTKGVWIWDEPFWVEGQHGKVAVFLVDTEGSLDLQRHIEISIKLCVFSILFSSYQIFNISSKLKRTDQDYLEVFLHVAKEAGKTCNLHPVQKLDLLVRDYPTSSNCGLEGGKRYLSYVIQELEAASDGSLALETLRKARCYLMPHPGNKFTNSSNGTLADMDEVFRDSLRDYVAGLASEAGTCVRLDQKGQALTGKQLASKIRDISKYLRDKNYHFSSLTKMTEAFAQIREDLNKKTIKNIIMEYENCILEQDCYTQIEAQCLQVPPSKMQQRLEEKQQQLLQDCAAELRGEERQKQPFLQELEQRLMEKEKAFVDKYKKKYKNAVSSANRKITKKAVNQYEQFMQKQPPAQSLMVTPYDMQQGLEKKRQKLLHDCRGKLCGDKASQRSELENLTQKLLRKEEVFMDAYRNVYKGTVFSVNGKIIEKAKREYEHFLQEQLQDITPKFSIFLWSVKKNQELGKKKHQELLHSYLKQLQGEEREKNASTEKLKQKLAEEERNFRRKCNELLQNAKDTRTTVVLGTVGVVVAGGAIVAFILSPALMFKAAVSVL